MEKNNKPRLWLIPEMGGISYVAKGIVESCGIEAEVIPTNTNESKEIAGEHIYTEVCHPLRVVAGDILAFLKEKSKESSVEDVNKKYAVVMGSSSGPCRFGKYSEAIKIFMDREGFDEIPIMTPSSNANYEDMQNSNREKTKGIVKKLVKLGVSYDFLEDINRRFRPYVENKKDIEKIKQERLDSLVEIAKGKGEINDLIDWGNKTVRRFEDLGVSDKKRFPLVLYIGEFYMRHHDPATQNVIYKLEDAGLEVIRSPVMEWFNYVAEINEKYSIEESKIAMKYFQLGKFLDSTKKLIQTSVKRRFMDSLEKKLLTPFEKVLHGRHVLPKPIEMIKILEKEKEFHGDIGGESSISIGTAYHFMNDLLKNSNNGTYVSGIFHVGPFTCMQETSAAAKIDELTERLKKKNPNQLIPIMHAFFGESANPNLDSEIEIFKEQCYQKRDSLKKLNL